RREEPSPDDERHDGEPHRPPPPGRLLREEGRAAHHARGALSTATGKVIWNVEPLPSSLCTWIVPPWSSMVLCTTDRPMPTPDQSPAFVVKNGSKMRGRWSALMPRPVSLTATRASFSVVTDVSIVSRPPPDFDMAPRAFWTSWMKASCSWVALP